MRPRDLERRHADLRHQGREGARGLAFDRRASKNINAVNAALKGATPWLKKMGVAATAQAHSTRSMIVKHLAELAMFSSQRKWRRPTSRAAKPCSRA